MGLETASFISELVATNPVGAVDDYATADDHLRLIKAVLQGQFPNLTAGAVNPTQAELNFLVGVTSLLQTQLDGKAPTAHSHTAGEISDLDTSDITTGVFADARIAVGNVTQHQAAIDHNTLTNWLVAEHVAWGTAGAGTIHRDHLDVASTGNTGIIELATNAERITGTDALRAITPSTAQKFVMVTPISISFGGDDVWATISDGTLSAANATHALIKCFCQIAPTSSSFGTQIIHLRETGSAIAKATSNRACFAAAEAPASVGLTSDTNDAWVKLNSSEDFDILQDQTSTGSQIHQAWIIGYMA